MSLQNLSTKKSKIQIIGFKFLQPVNNKKLYLKFKVNIKFIKRLISIENIFKDHISFLN